MKKFLCPTEIVRRAIVGASLATIAACGAGKKPDNTSATVPPDTQITSHPDLVSGLTDARFEFMADQAGSSFLCRLDSVGTTGTEEPCVSPKSYPNLQSGTYSFIVKAKNLRGLIDPSPAQWAWSIDTAVIDTILLSQGLPQSTTDSSLLIRFGSNRSNATYDCSLDGTSIPDCTSPLPVNFLIGHHQLLIAAIVGNQRDASPLDIRWERVKGDPTAAPETTLLTRPENPSGNAVAFTFSADQPTATFYCSLDAAAATECVSGISYTELTDGPHSFEVYAELNGRYDRTSEHYDWVVDALQLETEITEAPEQVTPERTAQFRFISKSGETIIPNAQFECELDGATYSNAAGATCVSPVLIADSSRLPPSKTPHTFAVRAILANKVDLTPATWDWIITEFPPTITLTYPPPPDPTTGTGFISGTLPVRLSGIIDDDVGVTQLYLNDARVDLSRMSERTHFDLADVDVAISPKRGLNTLSIRVVDGSDNEVTITRSFIAGDFLPFDPLASIKNSARIRLNQPALDELAGSGANLLSAALATLVGEQFTLGDFCTIRVDQFSFSNTDISIDPNIGSLSLSAIIDSEPTELIIGISKLTGSKDCPNSALIKADEIDLDVTITPHLDNHLVKTDLTIVRVDFMRNGVSDVDIELNCDEASTICPTLDEVIRAFIQDGALKDLLTTDIISDLETELEAKINSLTEPRRLTLLDTVVILTPIPEKLTLDAVGLELVIDVQIDIENPLFTAPGLLSTPASLPRADHLAGFGASISDDILNGALFQLWRGGTLHGDLSKFLGDELKLGDVRLRVVISPALPPVLSMRTATLRDSSGSPIGFEDRLKIDVGNFSLAVFDPKDTPDDDQDDTFIAEFSLFISAQASFVPVNREDSSFIAVKISLLPIAPNDFILETTRVGTGSIGGLPISLIIPILRNVLPTLIEQLGSSIDEIPIPPSSTFSLFDVATVLEGGAANTRGYLTVTGRAQINLQ